MRWLVQAAASCSIVHPEIPLEGLNGAEHSPLEPDVTSCSAAGVVSAFAYSEEAG